MNSNLCCVLESNLFIRTTISVTILLVKYFKNLCFHVLSVELELYKYFVNLKFSEVLKLFFSEFRCIHCEYCLDDSFCRRNNPNSSSDVRCRDDPRGSQVDTVPCGAPHYCYYTQIDLNGQSHLI